MLQIRQTSIDDYKDIYNYTNQANDIWWAKLNLEQTKHWLEQALASYSQVWSITHNNQTVGLFTVNQQQIGVYVAEPYRGMNLVEVLKPIASTQVLYATPKPTNTRCHKFLTKLGFRQVGTKWFNYIAF